MSVITCKCNNSLSNTGTGCTPIFAVAKKLIEVPYFDNTGAINGITLADVSGPDYLSDDFFKSKVNDVDGSKRWFPLPEMKNVKNERGDDQFQTFDDSSKMFINQGIRSFNGLILRKDASPQLLGKLKSARCAALGVYIIDKDGNLVGSLSKDGTKLNPIRIDEDTFSAKWVTTTDKEVQQIMLSFEVHQDENDEDLAMITSNEMTATLTVLRGLLDVNVKYSNITTSGVTATLITEYGSVLNREKVQGLVEGDFAINDITTPASGTDGVTETTPGVYAIAFNFTATSGDIIKLTPTKLGYDFTNVVKTTFVIP